MTDFDGADANANTLNYERINYRLVYTSRRARSPVRVDSCVRNDAIERCARTHKLIG